MLEPICYNLDRPRTPSLRRLIRCNVRGGDQQYISVGITASDQSPYSSSNDSFSRPNPANLTGPVLDLGSAGHKNPSPWEHTTVDTNLESFVPDCLLSDLISGLREKRTEDGRGIDLGREADTWTGDD
jgi:hypothetical protein